MSRNPRDSERASRLSLVVTHADGSTTRWGPDEMDASDIPTGLTFGTSIPGGFGDLSCSLLRRVDIARADEQELDTVTAIGPGGEIAWEGRLVQFPRKHGDSYTVEPGGEGWCAHLRDDGTFREIYVDGRLSVWGEPSVQRQINLVAASVDYAGSQSPVQDTATGSPSLRQTFQGPWARALRNETFYDAGGIDIGSIYYALKSNANISLVDVNWSMFVHAATNDLFAASDASADLRTSLPSSGGTLTATTTGRKYGVVSLRYSAAAGSAGRSYDLFWTCLAVYGNHGLTKRGTATATLPQGVYASDVIADAVSRAAPLLNYTTGTDGSISATATVLTQLTFLDPTTAEEVIKKCNGAHLYDWGVYDKREFFFRPSDPDRLTWTARIDEGAQPDLDGPAASDLINGVIVTYTDPSGRSCVVGPTGTPYMTATSADLADTDETNQVNAHGITRKTATINLSDVATEDFAITVGSIFLTERGGPQRRGQVTLTGFVAHPTAGDRPVWAIRAGDYIDLTDTNDNTLGGPRRIIATGYDHDRRSIQLTLDNTAYTLDALLDLLGAEMVNVR